MHVAVDLDRPTNRHHPNRLFQEKKVAAVHYTAYSQSHNPIPLPRLILTVHHGTPCVIRPRITPYSRLLPFFASSSSRSLALIHPISLRTSFHKQAKLYPFAEANAEDSGAGAGVKEYVHIRIQQRNGRKSLTTVQGLKKEFSYNKILKDLKKEFCCNGTVVQDPELGQVIQLQGDQRKNVSNFLVQAGIVKKDHIKIHGF
uniref:Protein translation factor SUI1 homolog n=1 Tax=Ananas comosus var. bracteatus TaxID=296719 RepID=A0A6V7NKQ7_ANACO|nr:unnamed protein product [Ananas comosus var. bracteatus]